MTTSKVMLLLIAGCLLGRGATRVIPATEIVSRAHWGMTQAQVLKAFPGEARSLADDITMDRQWGPDRLANVEIHYADIGKIAVRAFFLFDGAGKLDAMRFVPNSAFNSEAFFIQMEAALTSEFGVPTLRTTEDLATTPVKVTHLTAWVFSDTVAQLEYVPNMMLNLCIDKKGNRTAEAFMTRWMRQPTTQPIEARKRSPARTDGPARPARQGDDLQPIADPNRRPASRLALVRRDFHRIEIRPFGRDSRAVRIQV